mgnify:CR=1 FL=1
MAAKSPPTSHIAGITPTTVPRPLSSGLTTVVGLGLSLYRDHAQSTATVWRALALGGSTVLR